MKCFDQHFDKNKQQLNDQSDQQNLTIWINLPYIGQKGDSITKSCIRKIRRCLSTKNANFRIAYKTTKVSFLLRTQRTRLRFYISPVLSTNFVVPVVMLITLEKLIELCSREQNSIPTTRTVLISAILITATNFNTSSPVL